jgi:hypothetical protein
MNYVLIVSMVTPFAFHQTSVILVIFLLEAWVGGKLDKYVAPNFARCWYNGEAHTETALDVERLG